MRRDDAMPRVPGRGRGRRAAPRPVEEHLPGMWCSAAMMMASVLSAVTTPAPAETDRAASPSSGYGSDFSCGDADDGADVREGRPVSPAGSGSSSSSSSSYATWDAVEVSNGRWAAMGLLPYWSIWSPTNLDDGLLDELAMRQASGLSSGHPENTQDDEGDEEDFEFMTWVTSPPHCQTVDWGQFSAWDPVPTPAEAEALAVAAAEAEAARRVVAAKKKRERANKYGGRHVHKLWKE